MGCGESNPLPLLRLAHLKLNLSSYDSTAKLLAVPEGCIVGDNVGENVGKLVGSAEGENVG